MSLLSAALLQDDLNEGPQIRAAHWNQACGILRKGMAEKCVAEKGAESALILGNEGHAETNPKEQEEVAKR